MARGWESKDVESQQELAEQRRRDQTPQELTPEQAEAETKRRTLRLDQTRLERDLAAARHPRHKAQLEGALVHIADKLKELG